MGTQCWTRSCSRPSALLLRQDVACIDRSSSSREVDTRCSRPVVSRTGTLLLTPPAFCCCLVTSATCVDGPGSRYQAAGDNIVKGDSDDLIATYKEAATAHKLRLNSSSEQLQLFKPHRILLHAHLLLDKPHRVDLQPHRVLHPWQQVGGGNMLPRHRPGLRRA